MKRKIRLSPLFWPVKLKGSTIYLLDETALPRRLKYIKVRDYRAAARLIRKMKTRAVGQVILVLYALLVVVRKNKKSKNLFLTLKKAAKVIEASRPTLSFKYLTGITLGWVRTGEPVERNILNFLNLLKNRRINQAKEAAALIKDGDIILTHCNLSGLISLTGQFCRQQNKRVSFFVTETRPYFQGSRLTAWELKQAGLKVTIVADNTVAHLMQAKKVGKVIVGADNLAQNGDIANKIGTFQIALLAKNFKIPFYVICPPASSAKTGKEIKVEVRPDKELLAYQGVSFAPKNVKGYYPAFDITPARLITKHIYMESPGPASPMRSEAGKPGAQSALTLGGGISPELRERRRMETQ